MRDKVIKLDFNVVSLRRAVLCVNCDVITDSPHDICLVCGSRALLPLARVLGEMPEAAAWVAREVAAEQPSVAVDNVLVLTPKPHRARRRHQAS